MQHSIAPVILPARIVKPITFPLFLDYLCAILNNYYKNLNLM